MTAIRMSLSAVVFALFGACTQVEPPPPPSSDDVSVAQSELEVASAALTNSLQTCLKSCNPDDQDCLDCCYCLAHGGKPAQCCF